MFDDQLDAYHTEPTPDAKMFFTISELRKVDDGDHIKRIQVRA